VRLNDNDPLQVNLLAEPIRPIPSLRLSEGKPF